MSELRLFLCLCPCCSGLRALYQTSMISDRSFIAGTGSAMPARILTNDEIATFVDTNDSWITERTGIKERRISKEGLEEEYNSSLATRAARLALEMAGIQPEELNQIIVATCSPDTIVPSVACRVQHNIGASKAFAYDINAACSGFVYALTIADEFIRSGHSKKILVIGSEILSSKINWKDRGSCILFGDGAGAVVVQKADQQNQGEIYGHLLHSDAKYLDLIQVAAGGSKMPLTKDNVEQGFDKISVRGPEVFKLATRYISENAEELLLQKGFQVKDVDWFVPHQANIRIIQSVAQRLDISMDKVLVNIQKYGNTSAASIPIMLDEAVRDSRIKRGQRLMMSAFGGGITYGSVLFRF